MAFVFFLMWPGLPPAAGLVAFQAHYPIGSYRQDFQTQGQKNGGA
jgi:hypothetical protein